MVNVKAANVELLGSNEKWASLQLYYFDVWNTEGTDCQYTPATQEKPGSWPTEHLLNWTKKTVKILADEMHTHLDLERSAGNLPNADCFGDRFMCMCMCMCLYLYIHMNSPCTALELYRKFLSKLWSQYSVASQVRFILMSESCKVELLLFFFLTSYAGNMGFKCKWRLKHAMNN